MGVADGHAPQLILGLKRMSEENFCCCPYCDAIFRLSRKNYKHQSSIFRCGVCHEVFDSGVNLIEKTEDGFVRVSAESVSSDVERASTKLPTQMAPENESLDWVSRSTAEKYITDRSNPLVSFAWLLAVIGFLLLLSMQVKYFYVEKYAQNDTFRKYLVGFCKIADCELPSRKSPYLFTLTHTEIDLHPDQPDALRVTVKLVNEAGYSQPYPDLQITLTDRVGRIVGRRSFSPDSYLPTGQKNMIGDGELDSLLFDLARPHEKAVGFVVDIVTDSESSWTDHNAASL